MSSTSPTKRRPRQTAFDYAVVAVSPALIMTLVGSLVFFLLEVFQQSTYDSRLKFIFALWVFAAVLISRISMEEGKARAILFAAPLGILMGIAVLRFVEFAGALGPLAYPLNLCLLGFIWWATDKLTWDCTLVDDQQDASGQGLLQTIQGDDAAEEESGDEEANDSSADDSSADGLKNWWRRFQEKRQQPHPHGVWVVYFSVAALPLFGIGQVFVIESERGHAFFLLWVYLFSGFGLLVTTSLLGLRRYLRQRHIEMPDQITATWLTAGGILIVALMIVVLLVPRSFAQLAPPDSKAPPDSSDRTTTKYAPGEDGQVEEGADRTSPDAEGEPGGGASKDADSKQKGNGDQEGDSGGGGDSGESGGQSSESEQDDSSGGSSQGDDEGSSKSDDESSSKSDGGESGNEEGSSSNDDDPVDSKPSSNGNKSDGQDSGGQDSDSSESPSSGGGSKSASSGRESKSGQESEGGRDSKDSQQSGDESSDESNSFSLAKFVSSLSEWFVLLLKWLFFLAIVIGVAYFAWKNRVELIQTLRNFIRELRELWQRLFRRKPKTATEAEPEADAQIEEAHPFAAFTNPFLSGAADRLSPDELVKYTFEAFEAWATEQGSPRNPEQTPHEFAGRVGVRSAALLAGARQLADLYCQAAYAPQSVSASSVACLAELWQQLEPQGVFA